MQQYQAQREAQFQASQAARAAQQPGGEQPAYQGNNGSSGASFNLNEGNGGGAEMVEADGNQAEEPVPENEGF